ncbi:hypothetical protein DFH06DRAFT_1417067, partial [Mycena polygramma]
DETRGKYREKWLSLTENTETQRIANQNIFVLKEWTRWGVKLEAIIGGNSRARMKKSKIFLFWPKLSRPSAAGPVVTAATTKQNRQPSKAADALQLEQSAHLAKLHGAGVELLKARRELKAKDKDQQHALQELDAKDKELRAALRVAVQSAAPKATALEASIIPIPRAAAPRRKVAQPSTTEVPLQAANVELQTQKDRPMLPNDGLRQQLTAVTGERDNLLKEREVWIRERRELLESSRLLKTKIDNLANEHSALTLANTVLTEENSELKIGNETLELSNASLHEEIAVLAAGNDALKRSNASLVDENTALWANDERHQNSLVVVEEVVRALRGENELLVANLTRKTEELAAADVRILEAVERVLKERDKSNLGRIVHIKEEPSDDFKPGAVIDLPLPSDDAEAKFDCAAPARPSHAVSSLPIVVDSTTAGKGHNGFAMNPTTCPTTSEIKQENRKTEIKQENQTSADIPVSQTETTRHNLIRKPSLASPPPSNTPLQPPSVEILLSTPNGFTIAGAEFTNAQLMDRVMQKGGGLQTTTDNNWGLMLVHLELFAQRKDADFSVPVCSWRETSIALKEYYLRYLLHRETV